MTKRKKRKTMSSFLLINKTRDSSFLKYRMKILFRRRQFSIFSQLKANKEGLSFELDSTMRDGHHDMKLFVIGFMRAVSDKKEKAHQLESLRKAYQSLEESFDSIDENTRAYIFWSKIKNDVRKTEALSAGEYFHLRLHQLL